VNASAFSGAARTVGVVLILLVAAGAGLAVGNLIQQVSGDRSRTAEAGFSIDALDDLQATRDDEPANAEGYADYGIRHASVAPAYPDFGVRHPTVVAPQLSDTFRLTGPSNVEAPAAPTSDTFRLTGPSDVERTELRRQRTAN